MVQVALGWIAFTSQRQSDERWCEAALLVGLTVVLRKGRLGEKGKWKKILIQEGGCQGRVLTGGRARGGVSTVIKW